VRAVIAPIDLLGFLSFLSTTSGGLIIHFSEKFSTTEQEASCSSHTSSSVLAELFRMGALGAYETFVHIERKEIN